jgi:aryl-alcohol dehydrogenase-like predicted oxidoreductase
VGTSTSSVVPTFPSTTAAFVPIPGTTSPHRLEEHLGAADVELTPDDLLEIGAPASRIPGQGHRYSEGPQRMIDR